MVVSVFGCFKHEQTDAGSDRWCRRARGRASDRRMRACEAPGVPAGASARRGRRGRPGLAKAGEAGRSRPSRGRPVVFVAWPLGLARREAGGSCSSAGGSCPSRGRRVLPATWPAGLARLGAVAMDDSRPPKLRRMNMATARRAPSRPPPFIRELRRPPSAVCSPSLPACLTASHPPPACPRPFSWPAPHRLSSPSFASVSFGPAFQQSFWTLPAPAVNESSFHVPASSSIAAYPAAATPTPLSPPPIALPTNAKTSLTTTSTKPLGQPSISPSLMIFSRALDAGHAGLLK